MEALTQLPKKKIIGDVDDLATLVRGEVVDQFMRSSMKQVAFYDFHPRQSVEFIRRIDGTDQISSVIAGKGNIRAIDGGIIIVTPKEAVYRQYSPNNLGYGDRRKTLEDSQIW